MDFVPLLSRDRVVQPTFQIECLDLDGPAVDCHHATHKTPAVRNWFANHPRYVVHFTPTSASWLNLVERFFAEITVKRIRRGAFKSVKQLIAAIEDYLAQHNTHPKPFHWTATADEILGKLNRLCKRISHSGH